MRFITVSVTFLGVSFLAFAVFLIVIVRDEFGKVGLAMGLGFVGAGSLLLAAVAAVGLISILTGRSHSDTIIATADADGARFKAIGQWAGYMKEVAKGARAEEPAPEEVTIYGNPMGQPVGQYGAPGQLAGPGAQRQLPVFPDEMPADLQHPARRRHPAVMSL